MNPEVKKKWVKALRSGKYKQCISNLHRSDSFCCLGVLCDISGLDDWSKGNYNEYCYLNKHDVLPKKVSQWAGLGRSRTVSINNGNDSLAGLNDRGKTFKEIADIIEEQL